MLESFKRFLSSKGKVREGVSKCNKTVYCGSYSDYKRKNNRFKIFYVFFRAYTVHATSFDPACSLDPSYINFEIPRHEIRLGFKRQKPNSSINSLCWACRSTTIYATMECSDRLPVRANTQTGVTALIHIVTPARPCRSRQKACRASGRGRWTPKLIILTTLKSPAIFKLGLRQLSTLT